MYSHRVRLLRRSWSLSLLQESWHASTGDRRVVSKDKPLILGEVHYGHHSHHHHHHLHHHQIITIVISTIKIIIIITMVTIFIIIITTVTLATTILIDGDTFKQSNGLSHSTLLKD